MDTDSAFSDLSRSSAIVLLKRLYGIHQDIDDIIHNHLLASCSEHDGDDLYQSLERQLQQIEFEDSFIGYYDSYDFTCRLQSLLIDIETLMRERNPVAALDLLSHFLNLVEPVMNRVDDSDGDIGGMFSEAIDQWLDTAVQVRASHSDYLDWKQTILEYFDNNDYGCLDNFISRSGGLLTEEELRQLARGFVKQAKEALNTAMIEQKEQSPYNRNAAHACIGLRSVAEALTDMEMFEQATLLTSPVPNSLQMASLVEYAIAIKEYPCAEHWLQQPGWDKHDYQHRELTCRLLQAQGKHKELKQVLKGYFEDQPGLHTLKAYWEVCSRTERKRLCTQVEKSTVSETNDQETAKENIRMLLFVGSHKLAGECLVAHPECVDGMYWPYLTDWVENFEKNDQVLAAVICYRGLLNDILERGNTKAYHHAARYFHNLRELDKRVQSYQGLDDCDAYIRLVQEKHWRKRSFWAEADYPNKAE